MVSALLFLSPDPEGKLGRQRLCLALKAKKKKINLISIKETYFEGWMKTKEPLAFHWTSRMQIQGHVGPLRTKQ